MIDRQSVLQLMNESEAVYLATVSGMGPRIRALVNLRRSDLYPGPSEFCRKDGFTVYFSTSKSSGKAREIRENPSVAAYYCDPRKVHGAMLSGQVEILTDPEVKRALWSDQWLIYWRGGVSDPDYVVLRLKPVEVTGWWGTVPFHFEVGAP
jgi:general stress protein 26